MGNSLSLMLGRTMDGRARLPP
ncbi:MAG: hypothetical protein JWN70_5940, partial [Planctomycetaceae bacterium]|nr:hypothetical protein [Planctomycetaceae bacterium]